MRRTMHRSLLAALAFGVLTGGCTSADSKDDYVNEVNEVQSSALDAFNQTVSATPRKSAEQAEQLERGETSMDQIVTQLEGMDVPEEAQGSHPDLIAGYVKLREAFKAAATDVKGADVSETFAVMDALGAKGTVIGEDIDRALAQIKRDLEGD